MNEPPDRPRDDRPGPETLVERVRDLEVTLSFAARLLHVRAPLDDILWDVANEAVARLGLEDCVIYLVEGDHLVQRAAYGPKNPQGREILAPIRIPIGRGIVGTVAQTGRAERIADTRLDPRYITDDQARLSELSVPIFDDEGRVIGVLDSEHSALDFFRPHHLEILTAIASMTASRLALARLDEQLRELNRSLERKVAERTAELRAAHARSEELLRAILPASVAERLKAGEARIADRFDDVAVLFADLVGFTELSARLSPEQVVDLLERVFVAFEDLCEPLGCEKVKTVGDAFLAVAGVPNPGPDADARLAELALRMLEALERVSGELGRPLQVRIGLHVGPVVAGVIGTRKFAWDLWGDTVNTASRLASQGAPGRIQLTEATALRLRDRFRFEARGPLDLKGLGTVRTLFLTGRAE